jgi:hypothetical protein
MPPAAASPPTTQPDPQPSRAGRLLSLVRKLIDYGKELVATVRQRVAADPIFARTGFGTTDIALILTRIARGLHRAQALEDRVTRCAALLDAGPRRARGQSKARPSAARPLTAPPDPRLAGLPTAEQIAAEVRRRPIGAVIADICRDLGILPSHSLWRDVQKLIIEHGGSLVRLLSDLIDQAFSPDPRLRSPTDMRPPTPCFEALSGTGPPPPR